MADAKSETTSDTVFAGALAGIYQNYFVPLAFQPYASDLAQRLAGRRVSRVLEIGAGTGVVTRALAEVLPRDTVIVATDLNPGMLAEAAALPIARPVEWRPADAMQLPFEDASFDAVVCQFTVMFFPDKPRGFAEVRRVLRPGGVFVFNVWDRIEDNEFTEVIVEAVATLFPADPPRFMVRIPHGYYDVLTIERDLAAGGFTAHPAVETIAVRSRADSARIPAIAICQGTPMRSEIEARDPSRLGEATDVAAAALAKRFGTGPVDGKIQAHIVTIER